eukprot:CAMPEP_0194195934 /NCGR_PEP_ID=MMETSP0154-20130528/76401_1 /TAXON_ID=1049557 /ORGANISM="Thalassiothrix antarctica, Strain L6-D1" /LENGTH=77 /DNA_ID=CAMNT_0038920497 /DNA_START=523 /DNA_END=753 /DNA_ORIENTATION=+
MNKTATATTTMSTATHDSYAMTTNSSLPSSLPDTTTKAATISLPDTKGTNDAMTLLPENVNWVEVSLHVTEGMLHDY